MMQFSITNTGALWTVRILWLAMMLMVIASVLFAIVFCAGYVAQTWYPKSRYARLFDETDLFTIWMSTMLSGIGFGSLLLVIATRFIGSSSPFDSGLTGLVSVAIIASPIFGAIGLTHLHHTQSSKRQHKARQPAAKVSRSSKPKP